MNHSGYQNDGSEIDELKVTGITYKGLTGTGPDAVVYAVSEGADGINEQAALDMIAAFEIPVPAEAVAEPVEEVVPVAEG